MKLRNLATIYIFKEDRVLLIHRAGSRIFKDTLWSGIGGHFESDEMNDPIKCILRELYEETGIKNEDISNLKLRYITSRKADKEIRQQYIFFAHMENMNKNIIACDEGEISWINTENLFKRKMSFTNSECLKHYFEEGFKDDTIYSGAVSVVDEKPKMSWVTLKDFSTEY